MSQNQKSQFWLNGRWEYLDANNADNLDSLDSLDFAAKLDGLKALNNVYMVLGNNDWSDLIDGDHSFCVYRNSYKGMAITGGSRSVKIKTHIPIDPLMSYQISIRVKRIAGTGVFYCGIDTLDNAFNPVRTDNATTYNYGIANAVTLTDGITSTFTGVFCGFNEPGESNHNKFDPYGSYFDVVVLTDNAATDSSGYYIIEAISIKECIPVADSATNGLMSAVDKTKLDSLRNYTHPNDTNTRHVSDAEKSLWNSKANGSHTHTIANITGLQAELDAIKASASGGKDKLPSNNWKINPRNLTITATHDFRMCVGHIKLNYLDAIRVNLPTQSIILHTAESGRTAYLGRGVYLVPMTQVGKPVVGDTSLSLNTNSNCYTLFSKNYTIDAAAASTQYTLEGETIDAIPLTRDKLNPGYYAVYVSYTVGNQSGTKYTAFSGQTTSTNCYIGYDE